MSCSFAIILQTIGCRCSTISNMWIVVFLYQILAFSYVSATEDLVDWHNWIASIHRTSANISAAELQQHTHSRSFLHCCSLCHPSDGCSGVAYAEGECWLINGPTSVCRLLEGDCSTCDYKLALLHGIQQVEKDCKNLLCKGISEDGVYIIKPAATAPFQAYCDMTNGGWTVFQRRVDDSVDFYRGWADYVAGFGNVTGNFWAGLDNIHAMTSCGSAELLVTMETFEGESAEAHYSSFHVRDGASGYRLSVGGYSGTAGDAMALHHLQRFSTPGRDVSGNNCVIQYKGGWWYQNCHHTNPNGPYLHGNPQGLGQGIIWFQFKGLYYSLKTIEFKVRCF